MTRVRKSLAATLIGGMAVFGWVVGGEVIQDVRFARAQEQVQASRQQLDQMQDTAGVYRTVAKAVSPSVVSIEVHKSIKGHNRGTPFDEDLLRRFFPDQFRNRMNPQRDRGNQDDQQNNNGGDDQQNNNNDDQNNDQGGGFDMPHELIGTGSGVIMQVDGSTAYVVTNNHVAGGAETMTVTLSDGREIKKAKTIGTDAKSDLAVVKIEADHLIPAKWGDSDSLAQGDIVMAFGSPFGYVGSMSHGIVSALNRQAGILGQYGYENFIQTDAPINPGNSGGPLVDIHGNVIGINTAIATQTGSFMGIGFAIPSNQAKMVYEQLKSNGKVSRGFLGVSISDVSKDVPKAESFGFKGDKGALIEQVVPGEPADGKLKEGDIVTKIDGKEILGRDQLRNMVASAKPNTEMTFTVFRDGKTQDVKVKVGDQPEDMASVGRSGNRNGNRNRNNDNSDQASAAPSNGNALQQMGLRLTTPNDQQLQQLGLNDVTDGALVTSVAPNSLAAKAGIVRGDLITKISGQEVHSVQDARDALAKADLNKGVRLYVVNREASRFVFVHKGDQE
jgi:serine protease Do